jgi:hypothetical protein
VSWDGHEIGYNVDRHGQRGLADIGALAIMNTAAVCWAFFGLFTGIWKLVVVAVLALVLFGGSGGLRTFLIRRLVPRSIQPLLPVPAVTQRPRERPQSNRWFVFWTVVAAAAVASLVATRILVMNAAGTPH